MTDLVQREGDKLLPAEARIHAHDEYVMHHGQDIRNQVHPCRRIQHHSRLHAVLDNQLQRPVQMRAGLVVDA